MWVIKFIFLLFLFILIPSISFATSYYVSTSGSDNNNGTSSSSPWQTVTKVNNTTLNPGDFVYFKKGDSFISTAINPQSGTSGNHVTYSSYGSGDKPVFSSISIDSKSYITVDGLEFLNDASSYPFYVANSSYIYILNCNIYAGINNSNAYAALRFFNGVTYSKVEGCDIERRNLNSQGDAISFLRDINHNIINNNTIGIGTHYAIFMEGSRSAYPSATIRYNRFTNNIVNNPQGAILGIVSNANDNLFENNKLSGGLATGYDNNAPSSFQLLGSRNIVRNNLILDNTSSAGYGLQMIAYYTSTGVYLQITDNHIYNNIISGIYRYPIILDTYQPADCFVTDNVFKNNIIYSNTSNSQLTVSNSSAVTGTKFYNNIFYKSGVTNLLSIHGGTYSVSSAQSSYPTEYISNLQTNPLLDVNYLSVVNSSPGIDAGTTLTTVSSANGSGTTFDVADAKYFTDGWGYTTGDTIQIGNQQRTITNITNNTITVNSSITWTTNMAVSRYYNGSAPDIGINEQTGEEVTNQNINLTTSGSSGSFNFLTSLSQLLQSNNKKSNIIFQ